MGFISAFIKKFDVLLLPVLALAGTVSLEASPLQVGQTANPTGAIGVPYSFTGVVAVSGGTTPYTFSVTSGAVPPGLKLTGNTISGTPTASKTPFNFTVTVKDSSVPKKTGSAPVTLNVFPAGSIVITTVSLPAATIGVAYSQTLQAIHGVKPYTWSLRGNSVLPAGLRLVGSTISGTPTAQAMTTGFTIQAVDSSKNPPQNTAQMPLTIAVEPQFKITSTTLPGGTEGVTYSAQLASSGGIGTVTWKLASGKALVAGLTLSSSGAISGKPTAATNGAGSFSVVATDSASTKRTATAQITYTINPAVAKCTADGSGNARLKGSYAFQFSKIYLDYDNAQGFLLGGFKADGKGAISGGIYDSNSPASDKGDQIGSFTGTYAVGADDRGVMTVSVPQSSGPNQTANYCIALDSISNGAAGGGRMVEDDASGSVASGAFYAQGGSNFALSGAKGSWVFGTQGGADSSDGQVGRVAVAGYMTLDGKGKLTGGQTDVSYDQYRSGVLGNEFVHQTGLTGSYTVASNGRGTLTVTVPANQSGGGTSHMVFYVAGPNQVLLMNADPGGGNPVTAGKAYLRATTPFNKATLKGTYVYVDNGISDNNSTGYNQRDVEAGILTFDGIGSVTKSSDSNDAGTVHLAGDTVKLGTYSVDSNGRVTSGDAPGPNFYLVGPDQGFGVAGTLSAPLVYFEKQSVPTGGFTLSSFDGKYSTGTFWYGFPLQNATSGVGTANGAGTFLGTVDLNKDGNVTVKEAYNETYTAAASGRFVLKNGSQPWAALYMVSPTKGYTIDISGKEWEPLQVFNHQ